TAAERCRHPRGVTAGIHRGGPVTTVISPTAEGTTLGRASPVSQLSVFLDREGSATGVRTRSAIGVRTRRRGCAVAGAAVDGDHVASLVSGAAPEGDPAEGVQRVEETPYGALADAQERGELGGGGGDVHG